MRHSASPRSMSTMRKVKRPAWSAERRLQRATSRSGPSVSAAPFAMRCILGSHGPFVHPPAPQAQGSAGVHAPAARLVRPRLARFPDLATLARARPRAVREAWDGLGYYARAANLHRLAREVARRHGGRLPADPAALRALPGVGPYTAGAVATFAFELPVPAVDTNVARVIRRAFIGRREAAAGSLWRLAHALVPRDGKRAWTFNQAIMELGALVCTARRPKCPECPVRPVCKTGRRATTSRASPRSSR